MESHTEICNAVEYQLGMLSNTTWSRGCIYAHFCRIRDGGGSRIHILHHFKGNPIPRSSHALTATEQNYRNFLLV